MPKLFAIILLFTLISCGNSSNDTSKPVSKVDDFIKMFSTDSRVIDASIFMNQEDGKSGKFIVLDVLNKIDKFGDYYYQKLVFDITLYEQGESWPSYISKYMDSYDSTTFTIPSAEKVRPETIDMITDAYKGDLNIELGDYIFIAQGKLYLLEETESTSKDLEKIGALQEDYEKSLLMEKLSAEFGLSEERSIEVSNMIHSWKKISKKRSMTKSDANLFSQEILGTDMETAEIAYKQMAQGSSSNYESLINTAAEANDISPEHMEELVSDLMN